MFSKELENSISSLFDQATKTGLQYITVEHLLLMIMEDFEVRDALKASNCNISALNNDVKEFLQDTAITKGENAKSSQPTLGFQRVLQRSVFHVQSSGKGLVKHINILVAIFSEKESHAVYLLTKHGVSRLDVVTFISHGKISKKEDGSDIGPVLNWNPQTGSLQLSQGATQKLLASLGGYVTRRRDTGLTVFFPISDSNEI